MDYASPGEYTIGGITTSGLQFLDQDIIISLSGLKVGDEISVPGDAISNAIRNLWDQNLFTDIKIYVTKKAGGSIFLEIALKERARLSRFMLKGVKKGEADDIREKIKLVKGRVVNENAKISTVNTIKDFYSEKGYNNASVTIREIPDTLLSNSVLLEISIDKGNKVKIESINFQGNEAIPSKKLKRLMKDTREIVRFDLKEMLKRENIKKAVPDNAGFIDILSNLSPSQAYKYASNYANLFPKPSKFIEDKYKDDKQKLIDFYNSKGYRDAEIVRDTVYRHNKNLKIDMMVNEGHQYFFRNITWKGNTKYNDAFLSSILNIKKGEVYNQTLLDERLNMSPAGTDISSLYMDDGYLFFQVTPVEVNIENDSIDMEIRIYEGPQATINEVRIYGNTKTKEYVIRREIRTLPGNKFSRADLIRSQREIIALGYFDPEQMEVIPLPNPEKGTVDIEYHVVEKPSDQLELSAGWGGRGRGVVGSLGLTFTNFSVQNMFKKGTWSPLPSGDGQRLSLRVQTNGKVYQSYNMSFTEPWLGGKKPNSFSVSYYHTRYADLDANRDVEGRQVTNGTSVGWGTRLKWPDDFFTFSVTGSYERFNVTPGTVSSFALQDGITNNLAVQFAFGRNSVDQPIYPRRGSNIALILKVTPPYSIFRDEDGASANGESVTRQYKWIEYHKWRFNVEWFTPLNRSNKFPIVLRFSAKFGFLGKYNKREGYSPYERFELGGDGISNIQYYGRDIISLRGYDIIRHWDQDNPTGVSAVPFFDKFTLEMRFPFSLNQSATIYALAFVEAGNSWVKIQDYNPFDLKRSAGLGIRIFLPMFGMLGFDYGIRFDKYNNELMEPNASGFGNYLSRYGRFSIVLGFEPD